MERNKNLSFLLKSKPNEYMTPYQFIYKVVSLLLLNDNSFVYLEPIVDKSETYYLKFYFESGESFILLNNSIYQGASFI